MEDDGHTFSVGFSSSPGQRPVRPLLLMPGYQKHSSHGSLVDYYVVVLELPHSDCEFIHVR